MKQDLVNLAVCAFWLSALPLLGGRPQSGLCQPGAERDRVNVTVAGGGGSGAESREQGSGTCGEWGWGRACGRDGRPGWEVWVPDPAGKPRAGPLACGKLLLRVQAEGCHGAEHCERVTCGGLARRCWQGELVDVWRKLSKQHFCLALLACRTNTGRLEFPLGLSPTQTGLAKL